MVCNISYLILEDGISRYKTYRHCCCFFLCLFVPFVLFCFVSVFCYFTLFVTKGTIPLITCKCFVCEILRLNPFHPPWAGACNALQSIFYSFFSSSFHSVDNDGSLELNCFARSVSLEYFLLALVQYGRKILIAAFHPLIATLTRASSSFPSIALHIVYAVHARGFAFFFTSHHPLISVARYVPLLLKSIIELIILHCSTCPIPSILKSVTHK